MTDTPNYPEADGIGLFDFLQTIVDNLRLLFMGPIMAGLLAFAWTSLTPKTYESMAILKSEQNVAGQLLTSSVLDAIAAKLGYTPKMEADDAREVLKSQIKLNYSARDKLITLTTHASSPEAAQSLATDVLAQVYLQTQPRDFAKQTLQKQLVQLQTRESEIAKSAKLLAGRLEQVSGNGSSEVAQGYAQLIGVIEKTQENQIKIEKELKGIDSSNLIQSPTLPTKKIAPKRGFITVAVTLMSGFTLLIFVFIRQSFRKASQKAESARKINALKISWWRALGR